MSEKSESTKLFIYLRIEENEVTKNKIKRQEIRER